MAQLPLLVIDGYNVLMADDHYRQLSDSNPRAAEMPDERHLSRNPYGADPFLRSREALIADVAAYAGRRYEAIVVFDGADNLSDSPRSFKQAGIRIMFSRSGQSADAVIEKLVTEARKAEREVLLITSDRLIAYTVGGVPVTTVSSQTLLEDISHMNADIKTRTGIHPKRHAPLSGRISASALSALKRLRSQLD